LALAHALTRAISENRAGGLELAVYEQREGVSRIYSTDLADESEENGMQRYPIHLDPVGHTSLVGSMLMIQDGREALQGVLSPETHATMVQRSAQGTNHGGISIFSPSFKRLFHMRQYEDQQPQFIHRWLLRDMLSESVSVLRGKKVVRVDNVVGEGRAEVVFEDGSKDTADLVVGMLTTRMIRQTLTSRG
jgi:hypothetical protein